MKLLATPFLVFVFFSSTVFSQIEEVNPPGTSKIEKDLYIDRLPVNNLLIVEFMVYKEIMKEHNFKTMKEYLAYRNSSADKLKLPTQYLSQFDTDETLRDQGYYQESRYLNHPILTMTKEDAEELCEWRSEMTRDLWLNDLENLYKVQVSNRIKFRLPTSEELEKATAFFEEKRNFNYFSNSRIWKVRIGQDDYNYNMYSMYEFTSSGPIFKDHLKNGKDYDYTGFRCVCELE